jgi:signal transduction histidine kinase
MASFVEATRREVFDRSLPALVSFCVLGLIIFSTQYKQDEIHDPDIVALILILLSNAGRLFSVLRSKNNPVIARKHWLNFHIMNLLNAIGWGLSFYHIVESSPQNSLVTPLAILIITGLINASIFTLALSTTLHLVFICLSTLPLVVAYMRIFIFNSDYNALAIACIFLIAIVYVFSQGRIQKLRFHEKLKSEDTLKRNREVMHEQQKIIEHSRRLASMGEMAAGFAHEINNPLAVVTGHLELLQTHVPAAGHKHVEKALAATRRISKIVKNLRTLSHHSSDDQKTHHSGEALLRETIEMFSHRLEGQNVRFNLTADDVILYCDVTQISQIVLNLLNNALDAIEHLPSTDKWIEMHAKAVGQNYIVQVVNGGPPITDELCEKIFTPFFTTKPVGQGQGLGLAISRTIALRHQGELAVAVLNGHTCFTLKLPLTTPEA